jgi:nucleoside-diphosphate-sugar epimerase
LTLSEAAVRKTLVITGVTGFLGSDVAKHQVAAGNNVIGVVRKNSDLARLESIRSRITLVESSSESLIRIFEAGVDAVIHTSTCYGRGNESPSDLLEANIGFPLRLLEAALASNVPAFLNTDSFFSSNDPLSSYLAEYSLSKRHFTEWARIACVDRPICFINIRLEHLYGPGDQESKFINWLVHQCLSNVKEINLTPGGQKRDFIYLDDAVTAFNCILDCVATIGNGFHQVGLGTGKMQTMRSLIEEVHRISGSTTTLNFGALPYRLFEQMESVADNSFLKNHGWESKVELDNGIRNIITDIRQQHSKAT